MIVHEREANGDRGARAGEQRLALEVVGGVARRGERRHRRGGVHHEQAEPEKDNDRGKQDEPRAHEALRHAEYRPLRSRGARRAPRPSRPGPCHALGLPSREVAHKGLEEPPALAHVGELVERGARGREQDGLAGARGARRRPERLTEARYADDLERGGHGLQGARESAPPPPRSTRRRDSARARPRRAR